MMNEGDDERSDEREKASRIESVDFQTRFAARARARSRDEEIERQFINASRMYYLMQI